MERRSEAIHFVEHRAQQERHGPRHPEARGGHTPADGEQRKSGLGSIRALLRFRDQSDCGGDLRAGVLGYRDRSPVRGYGNPVLGGLFRGASQTGRCWENLRGDCPQAGRWVIPADDDYLDFDVP